MVLEPHAKHGVLTMGNEITEQEAREALNRIVYYCGHIGGRSKARGYDPGCDMVSMAEFAVQELSRRAAERAEREKPIDAEWLKSIGAKKKTASRWYIAPHVAIHLRDEFVFVVRIGGYMAPIVTRGQLLDLVETVKGGVE